MQKRTILKGLHSYAVGSGIAALAVLQVWGLNDFSLLELIWIVGSIVALIGYNTWRLTEL